VTFWIANACAMTAVVSQPLRTGLLATDDEGETFHVSHVDGPCYTPPEAYSAPCSPGLELIHIDDAVVIVNKPAFLPTENTLHIKDSVRSRLATMLESRGEPSEGLRLPHRLDWETSGLLCFARTADAMRSLAKQFAARTIRKAYIADVRGRPPTMNGVVELPLSPDPVRRPLQRIDFGASGRPAQTSWEVMGSPTPEGWEGLEDVRLRLCPASGRRHQLRMHCLALGCPIANDALYGREAPADPEDHTRQLHLHAAEITFQHPSTAADITFTSEPPFRLPALWSTSCDAQATPCS
jgi:tRNA pseudouridine32 synthase/23S rRNA pseudouridine746 synthase